jgi:hypothetical protein
MPDWEKLLRQAKDDIFCAVKVWSDLLQETFGSRLEYAYAKGSALKHWDSPIDYVPIISDLDIHIRMSDSKSLFPSNEHGFASSIDTSERYETRFRELRNEPLHLPRVQIVHINPELDNPSFFLPQVPDVHIMVGSPNSARVPTSEEIRNYDLQQLHQLSDFLEDIPRQAFDRVGLDFWSLLRRMNWRVSPAPIRLLTQSHTNPNDVWNWNRTKIVKELEKRKLVKLSESYQKFYEKGWGFFLSDYKGFSELREIVVHGYRVLRGCLNEVKNFKLLE